jgi:predicted amidophosphoribosyltransferase
MRCSQCQHENGEAAKFCEECGAKLVRLCASCGHEANPKAKFCAECGASLTPQAAFPVASSKPVLSLVEGFQISSSPRSLIPALRFLIHPITWPSGFALSP